MFSNLYKYYLKQIELPSTFFNLNIWFYANLKSFQVKLSIKLSYFIENLTFLKKEYILFHLKKFSFFIFFMIFVFIYIFLFFTFLTI